MFLGRVSVPPVVGVAPVTADNAPSLIAEGPPVTKLLQEVLVLLV